MDEKTLKSLKERAKTIRKHVLMMTTEAASGHPGGSLSAIDIITTLYFYKMRHKPDSPEWDDRDRFVLSKGHAAPALYAALAESGYFPVSELNKFRHINSFLEGHPCRKRVPGVDVSTGSLGQGLSVACGIAAGGKLDKRPFRVYALLGDGENQEGQVWEAAMAAAHYKLDNLTALIDRNGLQIDGPTEKVMALEPLELKWASFGWNVIRINGHDFTEISAALDSAEKMKDKPTIIIANTTKGKGISFMEGIREFHGKPLTQEQLCEALKELV
ncbi:MAG: transketolase [Candidatus Altiarchaeota archaeon]|nr:transketolase [Candidatus Altiarchaeota archaeon]